MILLLNVRHNPVKLSAHSLTRTCCIQRKYGAKSKDEDRHRVLVPVQGMKRMLNSAGDMFADRKLARARQKNSDSIPTPVDSFTGIMDRPGARIPSSDRIEQPKVVNKCCRCGCVPIVQRQSVSAL